jgi:hypothetical protein
MPQQAVPIPRSLSDRQYIADGGQSRDIILFSVRIADDQINVDNWF